MKVTESQIRNLIRKQLLKEFKVAKIKRFNWKTCEKIDLPDHLVSSKGGAAAIKKAEKAAAIAAQVYGVPGFACDIFSSMMGDNPNREYNRDNDGGGSSGSRGSADSAPIYAKAVEEYSERKKQYITNIYDKKDADPADKETAAAADKIKFSSMLTELGTLKATITASTKPESFLGDVNDAIGVESKYGKPEVKDLMKKGRKAKDPNMPKKICLAIVYDAETFIKLIAKNNLSDEELANKYRGVASYESYLDLVSR